MADAPQITIVTSVYKTEDYLPATVASILAQTLADLELILVEDGSPDGCAALCDELAKTDPRIRVFHQPNRGPASAMNVGLQNARGAYIGFVDSDDLVEPTMYQRLLESIQQNNVRMAACNADAFDETGRTVPGAGVSITPTGRRPAMELLLDVCKTGGFYGLLCWNKLFDITLFKERDVQFDETMLFGNDGSVLHRIYEGEAIYCLDETLYHYRRRSGSITAALFPPRKLDNLRMYWNWVGYFDATPQGPGYADWARAWYWRVYYLYWCQAGAAGSQAELKPAFAPHKKHLDAILPDLLRSPLLPAGEKLRALLFCAAPGAFYRLAAAWGAIQKKQEG